MFPFHLTKSRRKKLFLFKCLNDNLIGQAEGYYSVGGKSRVNSTP